jgi:hypothetical protein
MCQGFNFQPTSQMSSTKQKIWDNLVPVTKHEMRSTQSKNLGQSQPIPYGPRTKRTLIPAFYAQLFLRKRSCHFSIPCVCSKSHSRDQIPQTLTLLLTLHGGEDKDEAPYLNPKCKLKSFSTPSYELNTSVCVRTPDYDRSVKSEGDGAPTHPTPLSDGTVSCWPPLRHQHLQARPHLLPLLLSYFASTPCRHSSPPTTTSPFIFSAKLRMFTHKLAQGEAGPCLTCNTPSTTKAQDVTNVPSLMPEYKTWQQKLIIKVTRRSNN